MFWSVLEKSVRKRTLSFRNSLLIASYIIKENKNLIPVI